MLLKITKGIFIGQKKQMWFHICHFTQSFKTVLELCKKENCVVFHVFEVFLDVPGMWFHTLIEFSLTICVHQGKLNSWKRKTWRPPSRNTTPAALNKVNHRTVVVYYAKIIKMYKCKMVLYPFPTLPQDLSCYFKHVCFFSLVLLLFTCIDAGPPLFLLVCIQNE